MDAGTGADERGGGEMTARDEHVAGLIDDVDAAVFSGDYLAQAENRQLLKLTAESWLREVKKWQVMCEHVEAAK